MSDCDTTNQSTDPLGGAAGMVGVNTLRPCFGMIRSSTKATLPRRCSSASHLRTVNSLALSYLANTGWPT